MRMHDKTKHFFMRIAKTGFVGVFTWLKDHCVFNQRHQQSYFIPYNSGEKCCWATSHDPCEKVQLVDLTDAGISTDKLDDKKPPITVRDW